MRVKALFAALIATVCLAAFTPVAASTDPPTSPALVKQLVAAMAARQLDAIAAADPADPGRFIGALVFPGVQLLVISTEHKSADYIQLQINKRQFRDAYDALQLGIPASRIFFHDMGCDGFAGSEDHLDIYYEGAKDRTLLDGNWLGQSMTEEQYKEKRAHAERTYSHALTVLVEAVKKVPIVTEP